MSIWTDNARMVATRPATHVTAIRHHAVRQALDCLTDTSSPWPREDRITHAVDLLVAAVEKQARVMGLGRDIHIQREVA